jgi:hypothetical protein
MSNELMEKIAAQDPAMYQFFLDSAPAIQSSPFRDEILGEMDGILKQAGFMDGAAKAMHGAGHAMGNAVKGGVNKALGQAGTPGGGGSQMKNLGMGMAVSAGGAIAMALAGDMYDSIKRGLTKSRHYRNMLDDNPDLKELPARDVQRAFGALHQFNPEFASNALVAGSFVRRQAQLQEFDPTMLTNLVGARNNLVNAKKLPSSLARVEAHNPHQDEKNYNELLKSRDMGGGAAGEKYFPGPFGGQRTTP